MKNFVELKQLAILHCTKIIEQRIIVAETAMKNAQESANSEDKSSAGDKYETSRAMGHLDRDMNAKQLLVAKKELIELQNINTNQAFKFPTKGAIVQTTLTYYFIAVGIGVIKINDLSIGVVSTESPVAILLKGKTVGSKIVLAGKEQTILAIH